MYIGPWSMEKEYRLSTFSNIFYGLCALASAVFGTFLFTTSLPAAQPGPLYAIRFFGLALFIFAILIAINLKRRRLVIDNNSILYVSLFNTRKLDLTSIKGCRVSSKRIRVEPLSTGTPGFTIGNYIDFRDSTGLSSWAKTHFADLDAEDLAANSQAAADDPRLGDTPARRLKYLKNSKDLAIAYNIWGVVMGFAFLFVRGWVGSVLLMVLPILGIVLMASRRGTIKFVSSSEVSPYPFTMLGIVIPCMMMVAKSTIEYTLLEIRPLVVPGLAVATIIFFLLYAFGRNPTLRSLSSQIIIMAVAALLYGPSSTKLVNCSFDRRPPVVYSATVLWHNVTHGKSTTYYLKLSPWGPRRDEEDVQVDPSFFHNVKNGDSVNVNLKPGLLHMPWFYLAAHLPASSAATEP